MLQFRNPEYVLLYRGQAQDHQNLQKRTSLKPTLFRSSPQSKRPPAAERLMRRFSALADAEQCLIKAAQEENSLLSAKTRIERQRILRWALLQHYEVCPTPLLDVTHSLRIATSFASVPTASEAFLYVLGVPNLSGSITANAESGVQIVRLSSVCPPSAVRPHIQEGYLLGEYPDVQDILQKQQYAPYEVDFGRRLIGKFRFDPTKFWKSSGAFPCIHRDALYPDVNDRLLPIMSSIKSRIDANFGAQIR